MPVYEYRCTDCGHHTEVHQSFTDDPLTVCPDCGGQLKKVFSSVGIAFKGSGFYVNDSGSKKSGASPASSDTSSETPSKTSDGGSNGSGGETKKTEKSGDAKSKGTSDKSTAAAKTD